jgi:protein SCO1/2
MDGRLTPAAWPLRLLVIVSVGGFAPIWSTAACRYSPETKSYQLRGQVLAVHPDKQQVTIRHEDIVGYMPGMTMTFPVAKPGLLTGRTPGEMVTATLAVTESLGTLTAIEHTGFQELPTDTNAAAIPGNMLEIGDAVPDAAFIDQSNRRRSFAEWRGNVTLLTFIYTRCPLPNYCPLMDRQFAAIQQTISSDEALREKARLVSVSFDPEHDSPAILKAHSARLKADPAIWTFLTGDRVTLDRFAARFGVGLIRPDGSTEITHNLRTTLIGEDGRIVRIYSGNEWSPRAALDDLRAAVKPPS